MKAFRDTWRDGIHSYLTYLRDRLTVARELLTESGSCFVQIGEENVHRVRALMDEVFGEENRIADIVVQTTTSASSLYIDSINDHVLWYARDSQRTKYRPLMLDKMDLSSSSQLYRHVKLIDGTVIRNGAAGGQLPEGGGSFASVKSPLRPALARRGTMPSSAETSTASVSASGRHLPSAWSG